jgi:hypothetical protein
MNSLDTLSACAGSWRGTSTLQDPHAGVAAESPSTAAAKARTGPEGDQAGKYGLSVMVSTMLRP